MTDDSCAKNPVNFKELSSVVLSSAETKGFAMSTNNLPAEYQTTHYQVVNEARALLEEMIR
jgi:hypothetical protein